MFTAQHFGKYYLTERIAVGGMAEIFKATMYGVNGFEKPMVVKQILPSYAKNEEFIKMFIDEAKIAVQLTHGNIIPVYELGRVEDVYFIAMEYVHGKNLGEVLDTGRPKGKPLSVEHAVYVAIEVCKGLDYAHRRTDDNGTPLNVVHRDISPQNIMVSFGGEVKIADFGIAKASRKLSVTKSGVVKGTCGYMSPEQVEGRPIDHRTDIFNVGILLYELLTGRPLFATVNELESLNNVREADVIPPSTVSMHVPVELDYVVLKALNRNIEDRFQSADEFHLTLSRFLYNQKTDVSATTLSAYMKELFPEEVASAEEESTGGDLFAHVGAQTEIFPEDTSDPEEERSISTTFAMSPQFRDIAQRPVAAPAARSAKPTGGTLMMPTMAPQRPTEAEDEFAEHHEFGEEDKTAVFRKSAHLPVEDDVSPNDKTPNASQDVTSHAPSTTRAQAEIETDSHRLATPVIGVSVVDPSPVTPTSHSASTVRSDPSQNLEDLSGIIDTNDKPHGPIPSLPDRGESVLIDLMAMPDKPQKPTAPAATTRAPETRSHHRTAGPSELSQKRRRKHPTAEIFNSTMRLLVDLKEPQNGAPAETSSAEINISTMPTSRHKIRPTVLGWIVIVAVFGAVGFWGYQEYRKKQEQDDSEALLLEPTPTQPKAIAPTPPERDIVITTNRDNSIFLLHVGETPLTLADIATNHTHLFRIDRQGYTTLDYQLRPDEFNQGKANIVAALEPAGVATEEPLPKSIPEIWPTQATGSVTITTEPPHAQVWHFVGKGSLSLKQRRPGFYYFRVLDESSEAERVRISPSDFKENEPVIRREIEFKEAPKAPTPPVKPVDPPKKLAKPEPRVVETPTEKRAPLRAKKTQTPKSPRKEQKKSIKLPSWAQ